MRKIEIVRHITIEAFSQVMANTDGADEPAAGWLYELVPGDRLPVRGREGDTFLFPEGYAELRSDAWKWVKPGVTSDASRRRGRRRRASAKSRCCWESRSVRSTPGSAAAAARGCGSRICRWCSVWADDLFERR